MDFYYHVELRNKSGTLLDIFQDEIFAISWSYDALGGCAQAEIALRKEFDNFGDIDIDYDVRIYRVQSPVFKASPSVTSGGTILGSWTLGSSGLGGGGAALPAQLPIELGGPEQGSATELRWSGFVRSIVPVLDQRESVRLRCAGYVRQMEYIAVPNQTYASQDIGAAARSLIDTWVLPGTQLKRTAALGLCQNVGVNISSTGLRFDGSAFEGELKWRRSSSP